MASSFWRETVGLVSAVFGFSHSPQWHFRDVTCNQAESKGDEKARDCSSSEKRKATLPLLVHFAASSCLLTCLGALEQLLDEKSGSNVLDGELSGEHKMTTLSSLWSHPPLSITIATVICTISYPTLAVARALHGCGARGWVSLVIDLVTTFLPLAFILISIRRLHAGLPDPTLLANISTGVGVMQLQTVHEVIRRLVAVPMMLGGCRVPNLSLALLELMMMAYHLQTEASAGATFWFTMVFVLALCQSVGVVNDCCTPESKLTQGEQNTLRDDATAVCNTIFQRLSAISWPSDPASTSQNNSSTDYSRASVPSEFKSAVDLVFEFADKVAEEFSMQSETRSALEVNLEEAITQYGILAASGKLLLERNKVLEGTLAKDGQHAQLLSPARYLHRELGTPMSVQGLSGIRSPSPFTLTPSVGMGTQGGRESPSPLVQGLRAVGGVNELEQRGRDVVSLEVSSVVGSLMGKYKEEKLASSFGVTIAPTDFPADSDVNATLPSMDNPTRDRWDHGSSEDISTIGCCSSVHDTSLTAENSNQSSSLSSLEDVGNRIDALNVQKAPENGVASDESDSDLSNGTSATNDGQEPLASFHAAEGGVHAVFRPSPLRAQYQPSPSPSPTPSPATSSSPQSSRVVDAHATEGDFVRGSPLSPHSHRKETKDPPRRLSSSSSSSDSLDSPPARRRVVEEDTAPESSEHRPTGLKPLDVDAAAENRRPSVSSVASSSPRGVKTPTFSRDTFSLLGRTKARAARNFSRISLKTLKSRWEDDGAPDCPTLAFYHIQFPRGSLCIKGSGLSMFRTNRYGHEYTLVTESDGRLPSSIFQCPIPESGVIDFGYCLFARDNEDGVGAKQRQEVEIKLPADGSATSLEFEVLSDHSRCMVHVKLGLNHTGKHYTLMCALVTVITQKMFGR